ncbi:PepSY domain-containing protein [Halodesulfovibrio marinisediminis]|uniref:PepSY domain-containing protein n=1 Tax=Halodesulfovibrio marinisediminis DSM 17456 TaxID=1121457 RepID=A0A1N6E867_9BACT|nr:PepSY domain-containing protein [Halodesulfovibrio marinisediminis]SIN79229.1 hypothetical protein SAMN02745161_0785 [Halodesulfovibrio marinisediminis DSM 17456]
MRFFWTRRNYAAGIYVCVFTTIFFLAPLFSEASDFDSAESEGRSLVTVIETMQQQHIEIPNIIFAAEAAGNGVAIGFELTENVIEVTLLRDNEIIRVDCSATTGNVMDISSPEVLHSILTRLFNRYSVLKTAKISLREAIAIAEQAEDGFAYTAHIEYFDSWANYEIQLLANNTILHIIVDPENGRIVGRHRGEFEEQ